jgi:osmotically-inducible protein OsmY
MWKNIFKILMLFMCQSVSVATVASQEKLDDRGDTKTENKPKTQAIYMEKNKKPDKILKEEIKKELSQNPFIKSRNIKVQVDDSVVTISGKVNSITAKAAATADSYQMGAEKVINELKVKK